MSADHRKPAVAFIVLAFIAAALVGIQRADAETGRFLALGTRGDAVVHGAVPLAGDTDHLASLLRGPEDSRSVSAESPRSRHSRVEGAEPRHERASRGRRPARGVGSATNGGRDPLQRGMNGGQKALSDAPRTSHTDPRVNGPAQRSDRPPGPHGAVEPRLSGSHRSLVRGRHAAERTATSAVDRKR
jgi:hypothetical protein